MQSRDKPRLRKAGSVPTPPMPPRGTGTPAILHRRSTMESQLTTLPPIRSSTSSLRPLSRAIIRRLCMAYSSGMEEDLPPGCEVTFFKSPGPGGQHKNKTESGVRIVHRPSGIVVTATERRSQFQNRAVAAERLRVRLAALRYRPPPRKPTSATHGSKERKIAFKKHR